MASYPNNLSILDLSQRYTMEIKLVLNKYKPSFTRPPQYPFSIEANLSLDHATSKYDTSMQSFEIRKMCKHQVI